MLRVSQDFTSSQGALQKYSGYVHAALVIYRSALDVFEAVHLKAVAGKELPRLLQLEIVGASAVLPDVEAVGELVPLLQKKGVGVE
jgi:hypothetical protein